MRLKYFTVDKTKNSRAIVSAFEIRCSITRMFTIYHMLLLLQNSDHHKRNTKEQLYEVRWYAFDTATIYWLFSAMYIVLRVWFHYLCFVLCISWYYFIFIMFADENIIFWFCVKPITKENVLFVVCNIFSLLFVNFFKNKFPLLKNIYCFNTGKIL